MILQIIIYQLVLCIHICVNSISNTIDFSDTSSLWWHCNIGSCRAPGGTVVMSTGSPLHDDSKYISILLLRYAYEEIASIR